MAVTENQVEFVKKVLDATDRVMKARALVESLILTRKLNLPDPDNPHVSINELQEAMDPIVEREARTIILEGDLKDCVATFIMCYQKMAMDSRARAGKKGEKPSVNRDEMEFDREKLDDLFLVQFTEWVRRARKRIESENTRNARETKLNPDVLAAYDEAVKDNPVIGISNEELAAMVTPEEVESAVNYLKERRKRIKELKERGLLE